MIELTPDQAKTYEILKTGSFSTKGLLVRTGFPKGTLDGHIIYFLRTKMVKRTGVPRHYIYRGIEREYIITDKQKCKPQKSVEKWDADPADKFLCKLLSMELTNEQKEYLKKNRRKKKRSQLAKELGLTRLQLGIALERLG